MKIITYLAIFLLIPFFCLAAEFQVGDGKQYAKPSEVMSLVNDGDTVDIYAGVYSGDVGVWRKNNLYIRGVLGKPHLQADGKAYGGKAIWVVQGNNTTIENIEFSGCTVPDKNGAGIRMEGTNLTLRYCYFHDNEDGVLAGDNAESDIVFENCEFAGNGYGDGYSHNFYINHVRSFTMKFCYSHHARIGHCVKSRAYKNFILYNRIMDEETGTSSMLIDLPNGGESYIIGNLLMQGAHAENGKMVTYGAEGLSNPVNKLYVVNNTFVNNRYSSGSMLYIQDGAAEAKVINNIFAGRGAISPGCISGATDTISNMFKDRPDAAGFVDLINYDYRLLYDSPAIDAGSDPGEANGFSLIPAFEYIHPLGSVTRNNINKIDCGAYEVFTDISCPENTEFEEISFSPNPFNDICLIKAPENSIIEICDIFGRIIVSSQYGLIANGKNEMIWQPDANIPKGIYFIRVRNGEQTVLKKILFSSF